MTDIREFTLSLDDLAFFGSGLHRPESILATQDGKLTVSDERGGVSVIAPDGSATLRDGLEGTPNGLALDSEGNIYVANIDGGVLQKLAPDGTVEVVLSEIDGQPLGAVNYVFIDSQNRLWVSVSTRKMPWFAALLDDEKDGYIILIDDGGARIVADGFDFLNEIRLNADESYLYAAETLGKRMVRMPVHADGSLGEREAVGPDSLGEYAYVDGFALDANGNVWVTLILQNGLAVITPDGHAHTVFEDPNPAALKIAAAHLDEGTLTPEEMFACVGARLQFPASITFAGDDLRTAYLGSLAMPHLVTFESPVAGLPMSHWQ